MSIPKRPLSRTQQEHLQWMRTDDGSLTLLNTQTNETYHSGCGAVAETCVVYIRNSGVADRLISGRPTKVLELGFGTGTGFLLTAALAASLQTRVHYFAIEDQLLPTEIFSKLSLEAGARASLLANEAGAPNPTAWLSELNGVQTALAKTLNHLPDRSNTCTPGWALNASRITEHATLSLWLGPAQKFPMDEFVNAYDAIYYDPFSPATNPELWTATALRSMFVLLSEGQRLTSYCVKGDVRRAMSEAGFEVSKVPGPDGGKREVLVCVKPHRVRSTS